MAERLTHAERRATVAYAVTNNGAKVCRFAFGAAAVALLAFDSWQAAAVALFCAWLVGKAGARAPDELKRKAGAIIAADRAARARAPHPFKRKR